MTEQQRQRWRDEWRRSPDLKSEFPSPDDYSCYMAATSRSTARNERSSAPFPAAKQELLDAAAKAWRAEWETSEQLQAEFPECGDYLAFKKAESRGLVRTYP